MSGSLLDASAVIGCPHGGRVTAATTPSGGVRIGGAAVATGAHTYVVAGCPHTLAGVFILGLAVWALEFTWARNLLEFTKRHVRSWTSCATQQTSMSEPRMLAAAIEICSDATKQSSSATVARSSHGSVRGCGMLIVAVVIAVGRVELDDDDHTGKHLKSRCFCNRTRRYRAIAGRRLPKHLSVG